MHYSDTNYELLGRIIETVTGQSVADVFAEFIFDELGLRDTYAFTDPTDSSPAPMYYKDKPVHVPLYIASFKPIGDLLGTATKPGEFGSAKRINAPVVRLYTTFTQTSILTRMGKKVLIVEDDPDITSIVETYLKNAGFTVTVAADGAGGFAAVESEDVDLIILDWMLPDTDGPSFIRRLRARRRTPVIMLTARTEEDDRLRGFRAGADDYVAKPFSPRELVARAQAVLSRASAETPGVRALRFGRLSIEPEQRSVTVAGLPVDLTTREFDLLYLLARNPRRVFARDELLDRIWGDERGEVDRVVDVHVSNIRAKIEADSSAPRFIVTLRGVGYKFDATEDAPTEDER